ncbi:hypothetical protein HDV00_000370 [Rhizophlyctis rosea]|nr:hypothetical protein HDV00_000370 [Rhizophlyctis rosea]
MCEEGAYYAPPPGRTFEYLFDHPNELRLPFPVQEVTTVFQFMDLNSEPYPSADAILMFYQFGYLAIGDADLAQMLLRSYGEVILNQGFAC